MYAIYKGFDNVSLINGMSHWLGKSKLSFYYLKERRQKSSPSNKQTEFSERFVCATHYTVLVFGRKIRVEISLIFCLFLLEIDEIKWSGNGKSQVF